ncbi:hypothetical protein JTE90_026009 [Oedothorax gibbosus]|uniref:C2H2-type domain-containing protein n=1 Tax=Oedothorax gibbosus TaxID=931172 RepID=A0AAV6UHT2_9ARAC|nr:hypothetical protein JTE90_026009 [Oedothorax gibbosus]
MSSSQVLPAVSLSKNMLPPVPLLSIQVPATIVSQQSLIPLDGDIIDEGKSKAGKLVGTDGICLKSDCCAKSSTVMTTDKELSNSPSKGCLIHSSVTLNSNLSHVTGGGRPKVMYPRQCVNCKNSYANKNAFQYHKRTCNITVSDNDSCEMQVQKKESKTSYPKQCPECQNCYKDRRSFYNHFKLTGCEKETVSYPRKCLDCSKSSKTAKRFSGINLIVLFLILNTNVMFAPFQNVGIHTLS